VLTIDLHYRADHLLLCLSGELDLDSSVKFQQRLSELSEQEHRPVIIDLSGLHFVDSSGLGALVATIRLPAQRRPRIVLRPSDGSVSRLLRVTRVDSLLAVAPSVEAALGDLVAGSVA
jgi:anti-sigma B factor antagonist